MQSSLRKLRMPPWLSRLLSPIVDHYIWVIWSLLCAYLIPESTRESALRSLDNLLTSPPIQWQWLPTSIVIILMVLVWETFRRVISRLTKPFRHDYFFLTAPHSTFAWKANKYTGEIEKTPYCRVHKTVLIPIGYYFRCSDCGSLRVGHTHLNQVVFERQTIEPQARAIAEGHYHKSPSLLLKIILSPIVFTLKLGIALSKRIRKNQQKQK